MDSKVINAGYIFVLILAVHQCLKLIKICFEMIHFITKATSPMFLKFLCFDYYVNWTSFDLPWWFLFWNLILFLWLLPFSLGDGMLKWDLSALLQFILSSCWTKTKFSSSNAPLIFWSGIRIFSCSTRLEKS